VDWDDTLRQLQELLAELYPDRADAARLVRQAGLTLKRIAISDTSIKTWFSVLDAAIEEGRLVELVDSALRDRKDVLELEELAGVLRGKDSGHSFRQRFIEQVASLFELLSYEVQRNRVVAGRALDLFLTLRHADLILHRAVACCERGAEAQDILQLADIARSARLEPELRDLNTVLVCGAELSSEICALAAVNNIKILGKRELEASLLDGRGYATRLLERCRNDSQYPIDMYVVPRFGSDIQNIDRLAPEAADEWLNQIGVHMMALLGDVGTGKTFFARMTAFRLAESYLNNTTEHPLPLLIDLRDTDREVSLEGLVLTHMQRHGLRSASFPVFEYALAAGRIVLILDGFDEMAAQTTPDIVRRNFQELTRCLKGKSKLIITCRTHFFASRTEEEEVILGGALGPDAPSEQRAMLADLIGSDRIRIMYMRQFDFIQISDYLERARPHDAADCLRKIERVYNLMELAQRPMLLQMIVRSIDRIGRDEITPVRLYEVFTEFWIGRDKGRGLLTREKKLQFLTALARVFWDEGLSRVHYTKLFDYVQSKFASEMQDLRRLIQIDAEIRTASFLTRDDAGNYGFVHKSYGEYFLSRHIAERLNAGDSECLHTRPITREVLTFLKDLIDVERVEALLENVLARNYKPKISENCLLCIYGIRRQAAFDPAIVESVRPENPEVTLPYAVQLRRAQLAGALLDGAVLRGACLDGADLRSARLTGADLTGTSFRGADLEGANLDGALADQDAFNECNLKRTVLPQTHRKVSDSNVINSELPINDFDVEFSRIVEIAWPSILIVCKSISNRYGRFVDANDLSSEVAIIVLQQLRDGKVPNNVRSALERSNREGAPLSHREHLIARNQASAWLYTVARYRAVSLLRRERRAVFFSDLSDPRSVLRIPEPDRGEEHRLSRIHQFFQDAMVAMDPADAHLLSRYLAGFRQTELAQEFGVSAAYLSRKLESIRRQLRLNVADSQIYLSDFL
jgi:RNA polymerase sigma factor (sigma-70 family)